VHRGAGDVGRPIGVDPWTTAGAAALPVLPSGRALPGPSVRFAHAGANGERHTDGGTDTHAAVRHDSATAA
jgi:hypothetical protein